MTLRRIQLEEFQLLKEFKKICIKHNLEYYISGGTYLGAVRHEGFIPWDDDIDVAMPRKDYDVFVKIAPNHFKENLSFLHFSIDENSKRPNSRIVNKNVRIKNNSWSTPRIEPVWIDVFPLDGLPNNKLVLFKHKLHLYWLKMLIGFANMDNIQDNKLDRPWYEVFLIEFNNLFKIGRHLDLRKQYFKIEKVLRKYSNDKSKVYFNFHGLYKFNSVFNINDVYGEGIMLKFEGEYFNAPKDYDFYLTQIYGDYMKIPSDDKKNTHNTEVIEHEI